MAEPFRLKRDAQERHQRVAARALQTLPYSATEAERVRATAAIRQALGALEGSVYECEMRVAAEEAARPIREAIERRALEEGLIRWATRELPFLYKTEQEEARLRRECAEILAELPRDVSEVEGKEALEPTVREACREIEERQAEKERQTRKEHLVKQGVAEVSSYLIDLKSEGEISDEECWDTEFTDDLKTAVRRELAAELSGEGQ